MWRTSLQCVTQEKNNLSCIPSLIDSQSDFNYQSSCHTPNTLPAFSASGDTGHQKQARACVCGLILHQVSLSPKSITARYIKICYCGELILSAVLLERSTVFFVTHTWPIQPALEKQSSALKLVEPGGNNVFWSAGHRLSYLLWKYIYVWSSPFPFL